MDASRELPASRTDPAAQPAAVPDAPSRHPLDSRPSPAAPGHPTPLPELTRSPAQPWLDPARYWGDLTAATAHLGTPLAAVSLPALAHNAFSMIDRAAGTQTNFAGTQTSPAGTQTNSAGTQTRPASTQTRPAGKPIRIASKSIRVRGVLDAVLRLPGYRGVLAFTLPEALWLAETIDDVVVGYPTTDVGGIRRLATDARLASRVTLMIDDVAQLDLVDSVLGAGSRESIRVCIELDSSFVSRRLGRFGVWRSPVFTPGQARVLALQVAARRGFELVGLMGYEAQVAGVGNRPVGNPARARVIDWMQRTSVSELAERRAAVVDAVRDVADLAFVNGGGTGSIESTAADPSVTEIAAGSGLFGGHLFDTYSRFRPAPAAAFALSVVRKPTPQLATLLGGGWVASGPPQGDRMPELTWPRGLEFAPREMAGEVQSPVSGAAAAALRVGDRVWLRHTKSGELAEHVNEVHVVDGGGGIHTLPTYRGEGKAFL